MALAVPEGSGSSEAFDRGQEGRARFALPAGYGERDLWLRVRWNGNCSNSLFARCLPGGREVTVTDSVMQAWHWVRVAGVGLGATPACLVLTNREDGVWLDQLCLQPSGSPAPEGILETAVPWPPVEAALPAVSVTACASAPGVEALPPTEYLLHHSRAIRLSMPRQPVLVLFPGRETGLDVWLHWNHPLAGPALVNVEVPGNVVLTPGPVHEQGSGDTRLERRRFALRARPELPRGLTQALCRVRTSDGLEQVHVVRIVRPYRWLVSRPFRLNPAAGLEQAADRDCALLAHPLAADQDSHWRPAEPEDFTAFGLLNLRRAAGEQPFCQAYAFTRVTASHSGPATLDITHDDWIRVWINGTCAYSSEENSPSTLTRARVAVDLRQGENDVLVRSCQLKNYWEFGLLVEPGWTETVTGPSSPLGPPVASEGIAMPLPAWSLDLLAEDLPALASGTPGEEAWRTVAAISRAGALVPVDPWWHIASSCRALLRRPADRLRGAEALLELRRRAEAADLPNVERARLVALTCRERAALLAAALRPVEAAEEMLVAVGWTDGRAAQQALHAEVIRLFLSGDALLEATAYLDVSGEDAEVTGSLRGVVSLYGGDRDGAAVCYGKPSAAVAQRHAGWLLDMGRAAEAEWLLLQVPAPAPALRRLLARSCAEQRRFAEAEAVLSDCLLDPAVNRDGWEPAAADLARLRAGRGSLQDAIADWHQELGSLSHHAEDRRRRVLAVLNQLTRATGDPVAVLRVVLAETDAAAQRYRPLVRPPLDAVASRAGSVLLREGRYTETIEICNDALAVSPGQYLPYAVWRFQALLGLGREAAAAAVLASLEAAAVDPAQAQSILNGVVVSAGTAAAAERLARIVIASHPADASLGSAASVAAAAAAAAVGDYAGACRNLEEALALRRRPDQDSEAGQVALCRPWVVEALRLAPDSRALCLALLASPAAPLGAAAAEFLPAPDVQPGAAPSDAQPRAASVPVARRRLSAVFRVLFGRGRHSPPAPLPLAVVTDHGVPPPLSPGEVIEPGPSPRRWLVAPGSFPSCTEADPHRAPVRFDAALGVFGDPLPIGHAVVFLNGRVWVGTDRGVFCYHRDADRWDRLHLPDTPVDTPVTGLTTDGATLGVRWTSAAGQALAGSYDPAVPAWTVAADPSPPRRETH